MKLALMRTATGKEDPELPRLQRISSLDLTAPQIAVQINVSQSSDTSQHQLFRGDCVKSGLKGWIATKKPLLKKTNNKKRLACAKKHEQWTLDQWKSVLWFQPPCLCETQSRWTDDLCMCGSHHKAWRRRCDGALLVTPSVIYLEFKAHLTSMATTAFCSETPSHLVCT